jgi:hypothetical protein
VALAVPGATLPPQRADALDAGAEWRVGVHRITAVAYVRRERDRWLFRSEDARVERGVVIGPDPPSWEPAGEGSSRGIEVVLDRRGAERLNGWVSYAYGRTIATDRTRDAAYPSDFDQRHTVNVLAVYAWSPRFRLSSSFRYGSGTPLVGYREWAAAGVYVAEQRNQGRLPAYARLDVRAERTFKPMGRSLTLFVEVQNVLNRSNLRSIEGRLDRRYGRIAGATEPLMPLIPVAGVAVEF